MITRDEVLTGSTYKIKPPTLDAAIYITINDAVVDDVRRPVEIFINAKHLPSIGWVTGMARILSAAFRNDGPPPLFLIEELKQTFDADGGYVIPKSKGKRANSVVSHIGYVIEDHCRRLNLLPGGDV